MGLVGGDVDAAGEGDGERVECLAPALGVGAELASAVVADAADREVEDLEHGVLGGEVALGLGHFAELVVERFDRVGIRYDIFGRFGLLPVLVLGFGGRVWGVPEESARAGRSTH